MTRPTGYRLAAVAMVGGQDWCRDDCGHPHTATLHAARRLARRLRLPAGVRWVIRPTWTWTGVGR
ncbi:MAG: hypothetical protein JWO67_4557 [Streptosporangiaceae bacterium]|nr:hypothetical protein [Streptosporangiaceae bacterium]